MILIHFTVTMKNHAQAAVYLTTLKQAGANLETVMVETKDNEITGQEALDKWIEHVRK